ncbi:MAG: CHAT domain-containing tetratricopeptide repeat protein [Bacteroidota bacterium]
MRLYKSASILATRNSQTDLREYCINGIAQVLLRQGRSTKAEKVLAQIEVSPSGTVSSLVRARTLELLGNVDLELDRPKQALRHALKGIQMLESVNTGDSIEIANLYSLCGESQRELGRYDDAIGSFEKSLKKRRSGGETSAGALQTRIWLALSYAVQGVNDTAFAMLSAILRNQDAVHLEQTGLKASALSVFAFVEANKGLQNEALLHESLALELASRTYSPNSVMMAGFYRAISDHYCDLGEFTMALDYADRAIHILEGKPGGRKSVLAALYGARAAALLGLEKLPEALRSIDRSLTLYKSLGEIDHPTVAWMHEIRSRILVDLGRNAESLQSNQRALAARRRIAASDARFDILSLLLQQSRILDSMHRFASADSMLNAARSLYERSTTKSPFQLASLECTLATTSLNLDNPQDALEHVASALKTSGYGDTMDVGSTTAPQFANRFPDIVIDALSIRSEAQCALARSHPESVASLKDALESVRSAILISELERRTFSQENTRIIYGKKRAQLYERAVDIALDLERATGNLNYRYEALAFCDQRKAWVLREDLNWRDRWKSVGVPDSSVEAVASLDRRISSATVALELGTSGNGFANGRTIENKEAQLLRLETLRDSVMRTLPSTAYITEGREHNWTKRLQMKIPEKTAVIAYFMGERHSRVFVLTHDTLLVHSLANSAILRKQVGVFNSTVKTVHVSEALLASERLYGRLIGPIAADLAGKTHLVMVPDDFLTSLPFESLARNGQSRSASNPAPDFTHVPFLVSRYDVVYSQSVKSYLERTHPVDMAQLPDSATFAGFAPGFMHSENPSPAKSNFKSARDDATNLAALKFSEREVRDVAQMFTLDGHAAACFVGAEASKTSFQQQASRTSVLHVATHGVVDEDKPILSALLFSSASGPNSQDSAAFYAGEASTMRLTSDLVVLSSCESGRGKLAGTEGMLAMSRSFFQAGAKNVLYSLWPVGDRQSARLMVAFYKGLLKGGTYSGSLRAAKLQLLRDKSTAFPSKWAGFVLMGR